MPSKTVMAEIGKYPEVFLLLYTQFKVMPGSAGVCWPFVPQKGSVEHSVGMMLGRLFGGAPGWLGPVPGAGSCVVWVGAAAGGLSGAGTELTRVAPTATATATTPAAASLAASPRPVFAVVVAAPVVDVGVAELAGPFIAERLAVPPGDDAEDGEAGVDGMGVPEGSGPSDGSGVDGG